MKPITLIVIVAVLLGAAWYFNVGNIQGRAAAAIDNGGSTYTPPQHTGCTVSSCKAYERCESWGECVLLEGRCYTGADCTLGCTDFHYCICTTNADCDADNGYNCDTAKGYCRPASVTP